MKYRLMAYFDTDLEKFNPLMVVPFSLEDGIETIIDSAKKGQIPGSDKFLVYDIGSYETADGKIVLNEKPVKVADLTLYGK